MNSMTETSNTCPPECRQNWQRASDPVKHVDHCPTQIADNPRTIAVGDGHVVHTCCGKLDDTEHQNFCPDYRPGAGTPEYRDGFTQGYLAAAAQSVRMRKDVVELAQLREQLLACPDWCVLDHAGDDPADPVENLILHQGYDQIGEAGRKLLDASTLDIRPARTDCPQEGTIGTAGLYVRAEVALTTWEQTGELVRTILDGFGYLKGADGE